MATANKSLNLPANNSFINTWDTPINANFNAIDSALGGFTSINVVGASGTIGLTSTQYIPPIIYFSGALTASPTYTVPSGVGGLWTVANATSGAFTLTLANAAGGVSIQLPQGYWVQVLSDGTNIALVGRGTQPQAPAGSSGDVQFNSNGAFAANGTISTNGTNTLTVSAAASPVLFQINGNAGYDRYVQFLTGGSQRWILDCDGVGEGGSNTGSDFYIGRFDDSGSPITPIPLVIARNSGFVTMAAGAGLPGVATSPSLDVTNIFETATIQGGNFGPGTLIFYTSQQSVYFADGTAAGNFVIDIRHGPSNSLNSVMGVGQSVSIVLAVKNGATPYYCTQILVDGGGFTGTWQGGVAPTAGHANSIDVYTVSLIKVANATYTGFASQTQFK